jgi:hypothetical protein
MYRIAWTLCLVVVALPLWALSAGGDSPPQLGVLAQERAGGDDLPGLLPQDIADIVIAGQSRKVATAGARTYWVAPARDDGLCLIGESSQDNVPWGACAPGLAALSDGLFVEDGVHGHAFIALLMPDGYNAVRANPPLSPGALRIGRNIATIELDRDASLEVNGEGKRSINVDVPVP